MFSKACEYGIKAAIYIAVKSQKNLRVSLIEIAEEINSPVSFTSKVLQNLKKNKIIDAVKGPTGGFEIKQDRLDEIKLSHIVTAIDTNDIYMKCGLGFEKCGDLKPCPMHHKFKNIRNDLKIMLENTSLLELSKDIKDLKTFFK